MLQEESPFDEQLLEQLDVFLARLPRPVRLVVWADAQGNADEQEALRLGQLLAGHFDTLDFDHRPRRESYPYYPVVGVMGLDEESGEEVDYRVRFVGLPAGYQINSLVGAIQAVSFRASNIEVRTRIALSRLTQDVNLELFTSAENESGAIPATLISGLAVASPHVNAFIIRADSFPAATLRYSIPSLPHMVINRRYHIEGIMDEDELLAHMAKALKRQRPGSE